MTHHHVDHFIGFDRIVRANLDRDKALHVYGPLGTIGKVYNRIKSYEYPFFPFQKIVLEVCEILPDRLLSRVWNVRGDSRVRRWQPPPGPVRLCSGQTA